MSKPDANGWMPIETAPKDGSKVQFFCPSRKQKICVGKWVDFEGRWGRYWISKFMCQNGRSISSPTHWQPLPKPPVSAEQSA